MKLKTAWETVFVLGFVSVSLGLGFIFIRPNFVFFPEVARITHLSSEQLHEFNSKLFTWIVFVFRSCGAFILSSRILLMGTAIYGLHEKERWTFIS